MRTARSGASGTGTGSLKKIIIPSPVNRSSVPSCSTISPPHRDVILAQHAHDLLGLGGLREGGEAAQVQEHHGDLAPMALQRVLGVAADDQLGELGREEALEPLEPLELGELLLHAPLERAVPVGELVVEQLDPQAAT